MGIIKNKLKLGGDSSGYTLYDAGQLLALGASCIKVWYYLSHWSTSNLAKMVGLLPSLALDFIAIDHWFSLHLTDSMPEADYNELTTFVMELYFADYTLMLAMWPIRLMFGDDIPGINNYAEAAYDYSEIHGWYYIVPFWLKLASIALKQVYKYQTYHHLSFKYDEWNILEQLIWNGVLGFWYKAQASGASYGLSYALGLTYLQLPWNMLLWLLFDGEFSIPEVEEAGH